MSAFAQFRQQNGNQFITQEARLVNTTTQDFYPEISAQLVLFNGMGRINTLKQAKETEIGQRNLVDRTRETVMFNVASQYLQVLLDKELLRITEENVENLAKRLDRVKGMVEAGAIYISDQYDLEAQIKQLELQEVQRLNTLNTDKALLARTLLLDPPVKFEVAEPAWSLEASMTQDYDLESLYQMALTNRSDLKQFTHQQEAAQYAVNVARAGYLPTLSAFFNYNSYYNSTARDAIDNGTPTPTFEKVSFTEQVTNRNPNRSVGLRLSIPIFTQFTNKTAVTRAKMLQENARLSLDQINNTIYNDVLTGVQGAEAAQASYEAAKSQYESAKLAYDTQQARYEVGLSNIIQLTTAAQNFVQAESNLASARYTLLFQRILLDFYVGVLTPETILGN